MDNYLLMEEFYDIDLEYDKIDLALETYMLNTHIRLMEALSDGDEELVDAIRLEAGEIIQESMLSNMREWMDNKINKVKKAFSVTLDTFKSGPEFEAKYGKEIMAKDGKNFTYRARIIEPYKGRKVMQDIALKTCAEMLRVAKLIKSPNLEKEFGEGFNRREMHISFIKKLGYSDGSLKTMGSEQLSAKRETVKGFSKGLSKKDMLKFLKENKEYFKESEAFFKKHDATLIAARENIAKEIESLKEKNDLKRLKYVKNASNYFRALGGLYFANAFMQGANFRPMVKIARSVLGSFVVYSPTKESVEGVDGLNSDIHILDEFTIF